VFTHGDLSTRNILFTAEGMWFIDWEFSGYFPRTTEIAVLRQDRADSNDDHLFRQRLADRILQVTPLVKCEIPHVQIWLDFAFDCVRLHHMPDAPSSAMIHATSLRAREKRRKAMRRAEGTDQLHLILRQLDAQIADSR